MIKDRYLVSTISGGRYLDERLFSSLSKAVDFGCGAAVALIGLGEGYWMVTVKDRKKDEQVDFCQAEGLGRRRMSKRMARRMMRKGGGRK